MARVRSSLLWGLVGALAFLTLVQGYRLVVAPLSIGPGALVGAALVVGSVVAGVAYLTEHRLVAKGRT